MMPNSTVTVEAFIHYIFSKLLEREPDSKELTDLGTALRTRQITPASLLKQIMTMPEYTRHPRIPPEDLSAWMTQVESTKGQSGNLIPWRPQSSDRHWQYVSDGVYTLQPNTCFDLVNYDDPVSGPRQITFRVMANREGLRERTGSYRRSFRHHRIAIFGSSSLYGFGINNHETISAALHSILRDSRIEPLNLAFPMYHSERHVRLFEWSLSQIRFHTAILFLTATEGQYEISPSRLIGSLEDITRLAHRKRIRLYVAGHQIPNPWREVIDHHCRNRAETFLFHTENILPNLFPPLDAGRLQAERFQRIRQFYGDELIAQRPYLRVLCDRTHPNPLGARLVAGLIAHALRSRGLPLPTESSSELVELADCLHSEGIPVP